MRPLARVVALVCLAVVALLRPTGASAAGLLVPTDTGVTPLAIRSHRVDVQIHERVAETRVTQVFHNHTDRVLEATYIFPLPPGASVSGFAMTVNGQRQEGQVLEAAEARQIYEGIVARLRDPGLVEYMGANLFRCRVFPIPARGDQTLELRFTQTLDYESSTLHYRYPLRTTGPAAATMEDFTLRAQITSRVALRGIYSPTHAIDTTRRDEHNATVGFELGAAALDHDFDLYYTVADADVGLSVLTHHPAGEDGYFLMMVAPRTEVTEREIIGKDVLFVVDTSGSMAGEKIDHARQALRAWIDRLNPDDTFNILRFSTDVEQLADGSLSASADNRARALRFVNTFEASGGTAIAPALTQALAVPTRRGAPRIVVFLTDGMPTVGETDTARIIRDVTARNHDTAQIFAFGLGDDVNTTFLDLLAEQNRGAADYAGSGAAMATVLNHFYNMVAFPVLADLRLAVPGADAYDVYPRDLGTLYRGGQLVVTGRYRTSGAARVALTATVAGQTQPRTFEWPVAFAPRDEANGFIPRVWATRKVGYLLDEIRLRGENPEVRESVVQLARRFGIVTPYTSYLVTDQPAAQAAERPMDEEQSRTSWRDHDGAPPPVSARPGATSVAAPVAAAPRRASPAGGGDFRAFQSLAGAAPTPSPAPTAPSATTDVTTASAASTPAAHHAASPPAPREPAMVPPVSVAPSPAPRVEATGEAGRQLASNLRALRESERVTTGAGASRFVGGHVLLERNGVWEEDGLPPAARVLRVRALGRSYFALLRLRPDLRAVLAVGNRVRFRLDAARVIDVSAANADVSDAEVEAFLR